MDVGASVKGSGPKKTPPAARPAKSLAGPGAFAGPRHDRQDLKSWMRIAGFKGQPRWKDLRQFALSRKNRCASVMAFVQGLVPATFV